MEPSCPSDAVDDATEVAHLLTSSSLSSGPIQSCYSYSADDKPLRPPLTDDKVGMLPSADGQRRQEREQPEVDGDSGATADAENIYENEEANYVDMTSQHMAIYVMAAECDWNDEEDEDIYEDIDYKSSPVAVIITPSDECRRPRPLRPKPPRSDWKTAACSSGDIPHNNNIGERHSSSSDDVGLHSTDSFSCPCCCKKINSSSTLSASRSNSRDPSPRRSIDSVDTTTIPVRSLSDVARADHVTWKRSAGIWHHAIIVDVDAVVGRLEVVHYNGSVWRGEGEQSFASVRREWVDVSLRAKDLYRVDYDKVEERAGGDGVVRYAADEVVTRALSRLGETEYNPLTMNCEHFARWCKTGQPRSVQLENIPARIRAATDKFADRLCMDGPVSVARSAVDKVPLNSASAAAGRMVRVGARSAFKHVVSPSRVERAAKTALDLEETVADGLINGLDRVSALYQNIGLSGSAGSKARDEQKRK